MGLTLNLANLGSRVVRRTVGDGGVRRFATNAIANDDDEQGGGFWGGLKQFGGFLLSGVKWVASWVGFGLTTLLDWIVTTVQFVWNFNWNASDKELDQSVASAFNALGGSLGGTIGNSLGYLACGALPAAVVFYFNEPMGIHILKNVGEEALDELCGNVANLVRQAGNLLIRAVVVSTYKNLRSVLRKPDSVVRRELVNQGKLNPDQIDKAIAARNKPWSFAIAFDDFIDGIPNEFLRNFTEELFEEFAEACIEAGYVVANSAESFIASQRMANDGFFGNDRTIEITLNRDADNATTS